MDFDAFPQDIKFIIKTSCRYLIFLEEWYNFLSILIKNDIYQIREYHLNANHCYQLKKDSFYYLSIKNIYYNKNNMIKGVNTNKVYYTPSSQWEVKDISVYKKMTFLLKKDIKKIYIRNNLSTGQFFMIRSLRNDDEIV